MRLKNNSSLCVDLWLVEVQNHTGVKVCLPDIQYLYLSSATSFQPCNVFNRKAVFGAFAYFVGATDIIFSVALTSPFTQTQLILWILGQFVFLKRNKIRGSIIVSFLVGVGQIRFTDAQGLNLVEKIC